MKLVFLIAAALLFVGCASMSTGTVEGGRTDLERRVDTSQGSHKRIIRINPTLENPR